MKAMPLIVWLSIVGALAIEPRARAEDLGIAETNLVLKEAARVQASADSLKRQGKYAKAEPLYLRTLRIREEALGPEHPDVAKSLNNLADLYRVQGRYAEAEVLYQRSLKSRETVLGPDHADVAQSLSSLAVLYHAQGRYSEAEQLHERALKIREKAQGPEHADVAQVLNGLAGTYQVQGRYSEAEQLHERALKIREKALGPEHPDVAQSLNNLALLYRAQGRYAETEPLYQRALKIRERALGPEHPDVATSLNNLATLYRDEGRYGEAESLYERSLKIRERVLGPEHRFVGASLSNLAATYRYQGRYAEAELLHQRSLKILEEALGPEHPDVAASLNNLAALYQAQGRYAEAEPLHVRSLEVREKALGPEHPDVANSLNNLAELLQDRGRYADAESLNLRSLKISQKAMGSEHPDVASVLNNLAVCYQAMNRPREALNSISRGMWIEQANMGRLFAVSSEQVMRDYLATASSSLDAVLSLARESAGTEPEASDSAFVWTLRRKGMILETLIRFRAAQRLQSEDPAVARQTKELRSLRERLNRLVMSPSGNGNPTARDSQIVALRQGCNRLEAELNRAVSERQPGGVVQSIDVEMVRRSLPEGSALVELVRARIADFRATGAGSCWRSVHYFAFVLTPGEIARPSMVDLGNAEGIDRQVREVRGNLLLGSASRAIGGLAASQGVDRQELKSERTPEEAFRSKSRELYRQVFAPLRKALGAARLIYLAPDGELNRVPFDALVDDQGKYLIESYRFAYLTSGIELLEPTPDLAQGTVIFAAPDYDLSVRERNTRAGALLASAPSQGASAFRGPRSAEVRVWGGWCALPGTAKEATDVKSELEGSDFGPIRMYAGREALEEVLKAIPAPRVLHVATHGYFFADQNMLPMNADRALAGADLLGRAGPLAHIRESENPLLRSGVVLAGANAAGSEMDSLGVEDGWVTAEEIGMLDLRGTQLVVLSACETGLGDVRSGEGVSGLRRAFRYAGTRTMVMSLFQVADEATRDLMVRFYRRVKRGSGKLEALRHAQLEVMRERRMRTGTAHPFYWASFVLVGDPN